MSEKENLFSAEEESTVAEETAIDATEEVVADVADVAEESSPQSSLFPQEEVAENAEENSENPPADETPAKSNVGKTLGLFAGMFFMSAIVSILVSFLILHYMPTMKYNKAMKLIEEGKLEEAHDILETIDEEYDKAKYELKKFVMIPSEETTITGEGDPQVVSIKTKTKKNYYKLDVTTKDQMTGEDISQSQEFYYDDMGNVKKEVYTANGTIETIERKYDKLGNVVSEKKSVEPTEENSSIDYSTYGSESKRKGYKYYYVGK